MLFPLSIYTQLVVPLIPNSADLIKAYALQHTESGLGNDYLKRKNVIWLGGGETVFVAGTGYDGCCCLDQGELLFILVGDGADCMEGISHWY